MVKYKESELQEILRLHSLWLSHKPGGKRANLSRADLSDADLRRADLSDADLSDANLRRADLRRADLSDADLRRADLSDANLSRTNLSRANLSRAILSRATLSDANLDFACWPLWCGSLDVKIDKRLFCQLAYHLCRVVCDDHDVIAAQNALTPLANQFHRVDECGIIKPKEVPSD